MHKVHHLFAALAAAILLAGEPAAAAGRFEVQSRTIEPPEMGKVTQWLLRTEHGFFSFMPPVGASLEADAAKRTLRVCVTGQPDITVTILPDAGVKPGELDQNTMREKALRDHPGNEVTDQGACYAENEHGFFFDLVSQNGVGTPAVTRIGYVRISGALFEFHVTCAADKRRSSLGILQDLLTSFQALGSAKNGS